MLGQLRRDAANTWKWSGVWQFDRDGKDDSMMVDSGK